MTNDDLVYRLRKRAEIRRSIKTRKSVQEGKPDRLADLLDEAAAALLAAAKERDALRADLRAAAGELLVDFSDAQPGSLVSRLLFACVAMRSERDAALAEVERLKAQIGVHACRGTGCRDCL